jgi:hypothetical protein
MMRWKALTPSSTSRFSVIARAETPRARHTYIVHYLLSTARTATCLVDKKASSAARERRQELAQGRVESLIIAFAVIGINSNVKEKLVTSIN